MKLKAPPFNRVHVRSGRFRPHPITALIVIPSFCYSYPLADVFCSSCSCHLVSAPGVPSWCIFHSDSIGLRAIRRYAAVLILVQQQQTNNKMSLSGNSMLTTIGVVLILHSTYSCLQYRSLAMAADLPDTNSPPLDVIIEVFLGFALCLVGQLLCGPFHTVRSGGGSLLGGIQKSNIRGEIIAPAYRTRDFDLFTTRIKALSMAKRSQ